MKITHVNCMITLTVPSIRSHVYWERTSRLRDPRISAQCFEVNKKYEYNENGAGLNLFMRPSLMHGPLEPIYRKGSSIIPASEDKGQNPSFHSCGLPLIAVTHRPSCRAFDEAAVSVPSFMSCKLNLCPLYFWGFQQKKLTGDRYVNVRRPQPRSSCETRYA